MMENYSRNNHWLEKGQGIVEYAALIGIVIVIAALLTSDGTLLTKVRQAFLNVLAVFN